VRLVTVEYAAGGHEDMAKEQSLTITKKRRDEKRSHTRQRDKANVAKSQFVPWEGV
jgi:hypothetical protein